MTTCVLATTRVVLVSQQKQTVRQECSIQRKSTRWPHRESSVFVYFFFGRALRLLRVVGQRLDKSYFVKYGIIREVIKKSLKLRV